MHHVMRVTSTAVALAAAEGLHPDDVALTHIAALLHDACDPKYFKDSSFLDKALQVGAAHGLSEEQQAAVSLIAKNVSFTQELKQQQSIPALLQNQPFNKIFCCVQDADRLDAMGAVGIARTFTYGAIKNRPFYLPSTAPIPNPTHEQYVASSEASSPTLNHFSEKLLRLHGMLKTDSARLMGCRRHAFMQEFVAQFMSEVGGDALHDE
jgi:uncharacterized protein